MQVPSDGDGSVVIICALKDGTSVERTIAEMSGYIAHPSEDYFDLIRWCNRK